LIVKAARLFLTEVLGNKGAVSIRLEKKIPLAAGLGGGSSDAAATLQALDWLWETHLKEETLNDMGSRLGSDVPFFLKGGTALGLGRGEILTSWNMEGEYNVVLIKPSQGLSTPAVYQSGKASFSQGERARGFQNLMRDGDIKKISQNLYNGLESAALFLMPEIAEIKEKLMEAGALGALVSGSGPTVFGIVESPEKGEAIVERFKGMHYEAFAVKTVQSGIQRI
jgi:4-diphosphocytidyl-2-C-methyl-D-erythritol kinase